MKQILLQRSTLIASALVSSTALATPFAQAQENDPRFDAMALVSIGEFERACAIIDTNFSADTTDPDVLFLKGRCEAGLGNYDAARDAFNRVLAIDPGADQARMFIANTYVAEGDRNRAKQSYRSVLEASPPESIRRSVETALAALDRNKPWFLSASLGAIYDSNYNSGPADEEIVAFGLPFTLASNSLEQSSFGYEANVSGGYAWPVTRNSRTVLQAGINHTDYSEGGGTFDSQLLWGSFSLAGTSGKLEYSLGPRLSHSRLDNDGFRTSAGGDVSLAYHITRAVALSTSFGARALEYDTSNDRDGRSGYVSPGVRVATPAGSVSVNYTRGWVEAEASSRSFHSDAARLGFSTKRNELTVAPYYQYRSSEYNGVEPGFGVARIDQTHEAGITAIQPLDAIGLKNTNLQGRYSYASNDSKVDLYSFDRQVVTLSLTKRW